MKKRALIMIIINLMVWIILPFFAYELGARSGGVRFRASGSISANERAKVIEELNMTINEANTVYSLKMIDKVGYKKSEPYFESSTKNTKVIRNIDVFNNNCFGARNDESDDVEVVIVKIIDKNGMDIKDAKSIMNYQSNKGFIVGYYKSNMSNLYYGFIIDIDSGKVEVSEKGAKTNEETIFESEQEEKILYPAIDSFNN